MDKEFFNKAIQRYGNDPQKKHPHPYGICKRVESTKESKRFDWSVVVMANKATSVLTKL